MIKEIEKYAKGMEANNEVFKWIATVLKNKLKKKKLSQTEVEHVIDYLTSSTAPKRLLKMSWEEAKSNAKKWAEANQKKGRDLKDGEDDIATVHDFLDGTKIVKLLTPKAYKREGYLMYHCLGGITPTKEMEIYSYRDKNNMPHATFEVRSNGAINQIKGKGNGPIHPKYIHPILAFLETIGQKIRPSEMKNLGYYHIPEDSMDLVNQIKLPKKEKLVVIKGEKYAVKNP